MKERVYSMTTRAAAAEQTGTRIVDAMVQRFGELPYAEIRLDDIASDADVTVQTVIRRFGSKAGLMRAAVEREMARIVASREASTSDNLEEVVADLVTHYETYGLLILKMYAEAGMIEGLAQAVAEGRAYHLSWCVRTFERHLDTSTDAVTRERRLAQATATCDATSWRILRIDAGLNPEQTRLALVELLSPLLNA
jgi:AcrR family transcriptional regulator